MDSGWRYGGSSFLKNRREKGATVETDERRKKLLSPSSILALTDYPEGDSLGADGGRGQLDLLNRNRKPGQTQHSPLIREATRREGRGVGRAGVYETKLRNNDNNMHIRGNKQRGGVSKREMMTVEDEEGDPTDTEMDADMKAPTELEPTSEEAWRLTPTGMKEKTTHISIIRWFYLLLFKSASCASHIYISVSSDAWILDKDVSERPYIQPFYLSRLCLRRSPLATLSLLDSSLLYIIDRSTQINPLHIYIYIYT